MASKDDYDYRWDQVYAVRTHVNNEVKVGDEIRVEDRNGGSPQRVLSVTVMTTKDGKKQYKTLLLQSLENRA